MVIQYDCIPNYANWGAVTALYQETTGVRVPPDMKGSSAAMAALEAEKANPQADCAYYSGAIGYEAARRGLHQPFQPAGWDQIPDELKDPEGLWWTVHTAAIALIVNTAALEAAGDLPVPRSWQDLLDPRYKGLVAYDDPTWGGTAYTFVYGINHLLGGGPDDFQPGLDYLAKLDANIHSYPRESIYNDVLRGEVPIWINADGNGYKMRYVDGGPMEVVIPEEGSVSMPLVMGMVAGAPHAAAARDYLDWLLTGPAQAEFARSYFRPVIPGTMPPEVETNFLPAEDYDAGGEPGPGRDGRRLGRLEARLAGAHPPGRGRRVSRGPREGRPWTGALLCLPLALFLLAAFVAPLAGLLPQSLERTPGMLGLGAPAGGASPERSDPDQLPPGVQRPGRAGRVPQQPGAVGGGGGRVDRPLPAAGLDARPPDPARALAAAHGARPAAHLLRSHRRLPGDPGARPAGAAAGGAPGADR